MDKSRTDVCLDGHVKRGLVLSAMRPENVFGVLAYRGKTLEEMDAGVLA